MIPPQRVCWGGNHHAVSALVTQRFLLYFFLPFLLHLMDLSPDGKSAISLLIKVILGAIIVVLIGILAKTRHYYIAVLIRCFRPLP